MNDLLRHPDTAAAPLFRLHNENLHYDGQPVLTDVSVTIHRGEKIALIGKSGAGKSTLLKHLRHCLAESCAWCPQAPGLVPMLSVYHNIYMGGLERFGAWRNLVNLARPLAQPKREVADIANELGLGDVLWRSVDQLSGGQQQRVSIGRALYQQKPVLLADEPVAALDAYQSAELLSRLVAAHETAVIALHDVALAQSVCERVVGIANGRIQLDCAAAELDPSRLADFYQ